MRTGHDGCKWQSGCVSGPGEVFADEQFVGFDVLGTSLQDDVIGERRRHSLRGLFQQLAW